MTSAATENVTSGPGSTGSLSVTFWRHSRLLLQLAALLLLGLAQARAQSFVYTNFQSTAPVTLFTPFTVLTNIPPPHTPVTFKTTNAPATVSGYQFTHWTVAGLRSEDLTGRAANPADLVMSNANLTAVANYVLAAQDTGGTGIPDWYRLEYYGTTDILPTADSDGDSFDLKTEILRGYHPRVHDEILEGGISRRRSSMMTLILDSNSSRVFTVSEPVGITNGLAVITNGHTVNLSATATFSGYEFIGWFTNGVRADSAQGFSQGTIPFTITEETTFVARFLPAGQDSDADGMTDGYEMYNFNTLDYTLDSDPDNDGLNIRTEIIRGYSPQAHNDLVEGGISRRRSQVLVVTTQPDYSRVTVQSEPGGITNGFAVVLNGSAVNLPAQASFTGYEFIGWFTNGVRADNPQGFSLGTLSYIVSADITFTARYLVSGTDTDNDGLTDGYEQYNFGTLAYDQTGDPDNDGLDIKTELFRGYSPQAVNVLVEGGISRRRSDLLFFVPAPPDFAQQPAGLTNTSGNDLTLTLVPHGIGPFTYQWRLNGVNIAGATNVSFTLTNAQATNAGSFSAVISSPYGASNSVRVPVIVTNDVPGFGLQMADAFPGPLFTDTSRTGLAWNDGTTRQPGEPFHADKPGTNSVWLHWQAPSSGVVSLSTLGSGFDTMLAVYTGTSVSNLTRVAADEDSGGYYTSALTFSATAGEDYYFAVDGLAGAQGHIILSWHLETSGDEVPRITAHPAGRTVAEGARVPLHVQVVSQVTPSYQWFKNGTAITNATRDKLILEKVTLADVGVYQVAVWIGTRTNWSEPAAIQVNTRANGPAKDKVPDLVLTTNDILAQVFGPAGGSGTVALASATPSPQVGLAAAPVALSLGLPETHTFNNYGSRTDPQEVQAGRIWFATDNLYRTPSESGFLLVESRTDAAEFAVVVTSPVAGNLFAYTQVGFATNTVPGYCRLVVPVTAGASYFITFCTATESPVLYTNSLALIDGTLQIVEQPQGGVLPPGGSVRMKVLASAQGQGTSGGFAVTEETLTYVWKRNDTPIPGASTATYTATETGDYTVTVSTPFTSVDSGTASVTGGVVAAINSHPAGITNSVGQPAALFVTASGSGPLLYQWYRDGAVVPGANDATHQIDSLEMADGGTYHVVVKGPLNEITSDPAVLTVIPPNNPPVIPLLSDRVVPVSSTLQFLVGASDSDLPVQSLVYSLITGPTNATLDSLTGEFAWTPVTVQGFTTNLITIQVTDDGIPPRVAERTFTATVPGAAPRLGGLTVSALNTSVTLEIQATPGRSYAIQVSSNLVDWVNLTNIFNTNGIIEVTDPDGRTHPHLFYRSRLLPP